MNKRLLLASPHMSDEGYELEYIHDAFQKNWIAPLGENVNEFEKAMGEFMGKGYPVALSAGTAALHLAMILAGVKAGDTVFCQSLTFSASANPVAYCGAKPVFIDSERETWNMDPAALRRAFALHGTPKAVVVVHLYGNPAKLDEITAICREHDVPLIEDAAEALGSTYNGQKCGTFGDFGALSFNGNKIITTSGGGMLLCRTEDEAKHALKLSTQARENAPWYQHEEIGYNYRMSNICAGIGRGQMTVVQQHIDHHKHVQALYEELLKDVKGVTIHKQPSDSRYDSNFWLCTATLAPELHILGQGNTYKEVVRTAVGGAAGVIRTVDSPITDCQPNENVEALRVFMLRKKVECRPVWKPMHKQPVYAEAPAYINGVSEEIFKEGVCLPAGPMVTDDDVHYIVDCIKEAIISDN